MDDSHDKLADRIRKLLALAGNNPSEAEAASAMERAAALMTEHNLTMAEVEALGSADRRVEQRYEGQRGRQTWARSIWGAVARLNFCFYFYHRPSPRGGFERVAGGTKWVDPHRGDLHVVIGMRANVVSTQVMAQYLIETIDRLARECPDIRGPHDHYAFKMGCARRLAERLRQLRESRLSSERRQAPEGRAGGLPALARSYQAHEIANRAMFEKIYGYQLGGGKGYYTVPSNVGAYARGHAAGDGIRLDSQVKTQAPLVLPSR